MVLYFILPLFLGLVVLFCGLALYENMRNTSPAFERGSFWRTETQLLRVFESLLDSGTADMLDAQVKYFTRYGKYWRYDDEEFNGVELCEDEAMPLAGDVRFNFQEECSLAVICFEIKGKPHEVTFQAANGRLWGWQVSPPLPRKAACVTIKAAKLLEHPELALRPEGQQVDFPVQKQVALSAVFPTRRL